MKFKHLALAAISMATASLAWAQQASTRTYIVQLADEPTASYTGGVAGLAATHPAAGKRLDTSAASVTAYSSYLKLKRNAVLATIGSAKVGHQYSVAFNGFSAQLTDAQVKTLQATAGVASVTPRKSYPALTSYTPTFLGLNTPGGAWSLSDAASRAIKGEDVIIGDIDGGIAPENPSFADRVDANGKPTFDASGTLVYGPPPAKWKGICQTGVNFFATDCNNKLIGARYFYSQTSTIPSTEFASPRSNQNHGTHTASTAAGNSNVDAHIEAYTPAYGPAYGGVVSGMAPRARLAVYKACWGGYCYNDDTIAAIEQATLDGVDVISFSIGGSPTDPSDPLELAFLNASAAGIFVSAAAGNEAPSNDVQHIAPWVTTVGATSHSRLVVSTLTLGNGASVVAKTMPSAAALTAPLVMANTLLTDPSSAAATDCSEDNIQQWDSTKVAGNFIVCDKRSDETNMVLAYTVGLLGAAGTIILDTADTATSNPDTASEPYTAGVNNKVNYVAVQLADRATVLSYAAATGAKATLGASRQATAAEGAPVAPVIASFSSLGPNNFDAFILKPDIAAPGVSILAAVDYNPLTQEEYNNFYNGTFRPSQGYNAVFSGTSMATPHITGLAALLKQAHPSWSPAAIKSALMTSTSQVVLADGTPDPNRYEYGAGQVNPNAALATDLVYDISSDDYKRYLCGTGLGAYTASSAICTSLGSTSGWNVNLPSMTGPVAGTLTFNRTITNAGTSTAQYVASASVPGFGVQVQPSSLSLAPGQSQAFTVTLTPSTATDNVWNFGSLAWSNGVKKVTSPISAKVTRLTPPTTLSASRATGTLAYNAAIGYTGSLSAKAVGLVPATWVPLTMGSVTDYRAFVCTNVSIPTGTKVFTVATYDSDVPAGTVMYLGLYNLGADVYTVSPLKSAYSGTSQNMISVTNPTVAGYMVCSIGYAVPTPNFNFHLAVWNIGDDAQGTGALKLVAPKTVKNGTTASLALSWSVPQGRYLGYVASTGTANGSQFPLQSTVISVDTVSVGTQSPGSVVEAATLPLVSKKLSAGTTSLVAKTK